MKIVKQGITEIYDYTCEEIIEETCPICKAVFEYTENDIEQEVIENRFYNQQLLAYNSNFYNPCCSYGDLLRFPPPSAPTIVFTYIRCLSVLQTQNNNMVKYFLKRY